MNRTLEVALAGGLGVALATVFMLGHGLAYGLDYDLFWSVFLLLSAALAIGLYATGRKNA